MLSETFPFLGVKELKCIPIFLIKKVKVIPESYLRQLSKKKISHILEVNFSLFYDLS